MKKFVNLVTVIIIFATVFMSCEKMDIDETNKLVAGYQKQEYIASNLEKIKINKEIGVEHNQGVDIFLEVYRKNVQRSLTNSQKIEYTREYFIKNHDADISPVINLIKSNLKNKDLIDSMTIIENIDIDGFVQDAAKDYSPYYQEQVNTILNGIKSAQNDTIAMKKMISDYLSNIDEDDNFAPNEKEYFINSLYVLNSSITYWYNYKLDTKMDEDDYWKIPVSDWAGGIIGLIGGPAGSVSGFVSGSVLMAIGLW